jgi:hypothetical protein
MRLMKPLPHLLRRKPLPAAALLLCLAFPSPAAQPRATSPAVPAPASTNALPVQPEVPKSLFVIPSSPRAGKDPFFPNSLRPYGPSLVSPDLKTNVPPAAAVVELHLNGISGTADRRFAIINNRTFGANEEGVVPTSSGPPARIRCLEIKADSALVQIGGERRLLRLRSGF